MKRKKGTEQKPESTSETSKVVGTISGEQVADLLGVLDGPPPAPVDNTPVLAPITIELPQEKGAEHYDDRYKYGYDWGCYFGIAKKITEYMLISGAKNKKIIDIGCGVGWFADLIYFNVTPYVRGIDFSYKAVVWHGAHLFPQVHLEVGNIYEHDYKGYWGAVLMEVLEHLEKDVELIEKLPIGCRIYGSVPYDRERMDEGHLRLYLPGGLEHRYGHLMEIRLEQRMGQWIIFEAVRRDRKDKARVEVVK